MSKFLSSKIFTGLLLFGVGWLILSLISLDSRRSLSDQEVSGLKDKIARVEDRNSYLEKLSDYFQSPSFLEKQARIKLNYKSPDEEVVFVYKDVEAKKVSSSLVFDELLKKMPNYEKWWYWMWGF